MDMLESSYIPKSPSQHIYVESKQLLYGKISNI